MGGFWVDNSTIPVPSYSNPADLPSRQKAHEACHLWNLQFAGDIVLPPELMITIVDGVSFPEVACVESDLKWVISQRGKEKDDK